MRKDDRKHNILVVEDNPGDFFLVQDYLEELIDLPKIQRAKNFKETEAILSNPKVDFDVILLDISLPDKEGKPLIKAVTKYSNRTPIVILTGFSNLDFAIESLSLGVSDYLLKDELNSSLLYKSIVYNIERNRNLVKLQESEQKYADLFHLSPQPMWVYDTNTLKFLDVNDAAIKHYHYSKTDFLSMTIKDIRSKEEIPKLEAVLAERKNKKKSFYRGQFRHQKKNGEIIDVDIQSNLIKYNGLDARIILANDITDHLVYINTIEEQNSRLREIAWIQSHVVRAPLSRIMGIAQMIKSGMVELSTEERLEFLSHILKSADELDEIINDVSKKTKEFEIKESMRWS